MFNQTKLVSTDWCWMPYAVLADYKRAPNHKWSRHIYTCHMMHYVLFEVTVSCVSKEFTTYVYLFVHCQTWDCAYICVCVGGGGGGALVLVCVCVCVWEREGGGCVSLRLRALVCVCLCAVVVSYFVSVLHENPFCIISSSSTSSSSSSSSSRVT